MPFRDQTGPNGNGSLSGRQMGVCPNAVPMYGGMQQNFRRFYRRNRFFNNAKTYNQPLTKEMLINEKKRLEASLETINQQLNEN